jgi:hypothetical protein
MKRRVCATWSNWFVIAWMCCGAVCGAEELSFEHDIRPIFRTYCYECHGATEKVEGGLDLRLVRFIERGGDSGPAITKGDADASYLWQRVSAGEMPPNGHPVPADQLTILQQWIAQGAPTLRAEPESIGPGLGISEEEQNHWAFQPIRRPAPPAVQAGDRVRTPIDQFVLARLEAVGLTYAEEASRTTLLRRASLDLIGLPPTPEQIDEFLNDSSPVAWEHALDRLLDSPHYGERWARHWLDVVGYADSEGYSTQDTPRAWAYKYRDWVIRALNDDLPIDQFIVWQLAGDELVTPPYENLSSEDIDKLVATGFLRMAVDGTASSNDDTARNQVIGDTIKVLSSSLLGLTVGCAQCHDHRYDPISQEDYYRIRAILEPAMDCTNWKTPPQRQISLLTAEQRELTRQIEAKAQLRADERAAKEKEFMETALQGELAKCDESQRAALDAAYRTPKDQRSAQQNELLALHPNIASLHPGVLYQYNQEHANQLKELDTEIAAIRAQKPREEFVRALSEPGNGVALPVTRLFYRGDFRQPLQPVTPGDLTVATLRETEWGIADNEPALTSSGRRLAYARWLTSGRHPLVARVLVNRFWMHHFGKAIVATPDDFGKLGTAPTHPELLDWLADNFVNNGWSLKEFHRLVMTSSVYRQQSLRHPAGNAVDASDDLYWHFPVRRAEAEVLRDAMLSVSGRLQTELLGEPVTVNADDTGQVVVSGEMQRRSIYLQVRRTMPVAMLAAFDAPQMEVNCALRPRSTAATQSLMLMNSQFTLDCAAALARRIGAEADHRSDSTLAACEPDSPASWLPTSEDVGSDTIYQAEVAIVPEIVRAWWLVYNRAPEFDELTEAVVYVKQQCELLRGRGAKAPLMQAMTNLCQSLLSSNEMLYLE